MKIAKIDLCKLNIDEMTDAEKADVCFRAVKVLDGAMGQIDLMYREIGRFLEYLYAGELYKHYSGDVKTWPQFIKAIDVGFGVSEADHLRRVHRVFEPYLEGRRIKFRRLLEAIPVVTEKNMPDLLDSAEHLPASGWSDTIRELKKKPTTDACLHPKEFCSLYTHCSRCDKWLKVE